MPPAFALSQDQTLQLKVVVHSPKASSRECWTSILVRPGIQRQQFALHCAEWSFIFNLSADTGLHLSQIEMTACKGGGFGGYSRRVRCVQTRREPQPCGCCPNCSLVKDQPLPACIGRAAKRLWPPCFASASRSATSNAVYSIRRYCQPHRPVNLKFFFLAICTHHLEHRQRQSYLLKNAGVLAHFP